MTRRHDNVTARPVRRREGAAFTLIELLIVLFILGVLVTLVVGVTRYVLNEGRRKETITTEALVMQAVEAFHEVTGEYPPEADAKYPDYLPNEESIRVLVHYLKGDAPVTASVPIRNRINERTGDFLLKLPKDAFTGSGVIRDGFGEALEYDDDGGLGGRPVVISGGEDCDTATAEDNIRSDEQE